MEHARSSLPRHAPARRPVLPLLAAVTALLLFSLLALSGARAGELKAGDIPPDKLGKTAAGDHVLLSDYRGKLVIISFWASWCHPCRKEQPLLADIQHQATRDKLVVFSVNWRESYDKFLAIKKVLKDVDLTLVSDESGYIGNEYGVKAIPHMVIIGRDGKIARIHIGYSEQNIPALVDEINALLAQSPSSS